MSRGTGAANLRPGRSRPFVRVRLCQKMSRKFPDIKLRSNQSVATRSYQYAEAHLRRRSAPARRRLAWPAWPAARPQKAPTNGSCTATPIGVTSLTRRPAPQQEEPRSAWSGALRGHVRLEPQAARLPPSSAWTADPNWRAMVFPAAAAVLCCCTWPRNTGLMISNYASDLGWSYGDSNPRPLACHTTAPRPPQSICAGHRLRTSASVPRNPGRLLYFRAVRIRPDKRHRHRPVRDHHVRVRQPGPARLTTLVSHPSQRKARQSFPGLPRLSGCEASFGATAGVAASQICTVRSRRPRGGGQAPAPARLTADALAGNSAQARGLRRWPRLPPSDPNPQRMLRQAAATTVIR